MGASREELGKGSAGLPCTTHIEREDRHSRVEPRCEIEGKCSRNAALERPRSGLVKHDRHDVTVEDGRKAFRSHAVEHLMHCEGVLAEEVRKRHQGSSAPASGPGAAPADLSTEPASGSDTTEIKF